MVHILQVSLIFQYFLSFERKNLEDPIQHEPISILSATRSIFSVAAQQSLMEYAVLFFPETTITVGA
jgi:hypothetical protein